MHELNDISPKLNCHLPRPHRADGPRGGQPGDKPALSRSKTPITRGRPKRTEARSTERAPYSQRAVPPGTASDKTAAAHEGRPESPRRARTQTPCTERPAGETVGRDTNFMTSIGPAVQYSSRMVLRPPNTPPARKAPGQPDGCMSASTQAMAVKVHPPESI